MGLTAVVSQAGIEERGFDVSFFFFACSLCLLLFFFLKTSIIFLIQILHIFQAPKSERNSRKSFSLMIEILRLLFVRPKFLPQMKLC